MHFFINDEYYISHLGNQNDHRREKIEVVIRFAVNAAPSRHSSWPLHIYETGPLASTVVRQPCHYPGLAYALPVQ